ncbi:MAG: tRNA (cytidine(56)-2'-O)-methyltransferase [Candidatus Aenigmarchaeota archaeon]|nr:tRNA (cytidine(56)-2'-O)-methyltransferase [Candidatus Aenigmarchaeota archaeon]
MKVYVLRLGHRIGRDKRVSTHCGLVSRAFGADGIIYAGEYDPHMMDSVKRVSKEWGGSFSIRYEKSWKNFVKAWKKKAGKVVHLTMYGVPIERKIDEIRNCKRLLVVVGGEKVPPEVYEIADFNISVTNQPHSEIAALAIFLDRYFQGKELKKTFRNAKKKIVPQKRGKKVIEHK